MQTDERDYRSRLHRVIPGGAHTYSRGDDQFPVNAPAILSHGKGCYVWDSDGKRYLDYGMALRAVTVGYDYEPISAAAIEAIHKGNNLTRASMLELAAAEKLVEIIPSADMVKFGKNGSTVTTAAVKLARAYTGREYVAVCSDHPFFTYDDWFIGTTPIQRGIPDPHKQLTLTFPYNSLPGLEELFARHPSKVAAVIMEPVTSLPPESGYLEGVRELCTQHGAVFILDEMITGFRWSLGGAQQYFGVQPDLCTFGKGMANGFSVSALAGKREIMELGAIQSPGAERVFLMSTTHGAEMASLGAFLKTVEVYQEMGVVDHLWDYGNKLITELNRLSVEMGLQGHFQVEGYACSPVYTWRDAAGQVSLPLRTLFLQEMVRGGVLMPYIALSRAHGAEELELTLSAARSAFTVCSRALSDGIERHLEGPAIKPVFRTFN